MFRAYSNCTCIFHLLCRLECSVFYGYFCVTGSIEGYQSAVILGIVQRCTGDNNLAAVLCSRYDSIIISTAVCCGNHTVHSQQVCGCVQCDVRCWETGVVLDGQCHCGCTSRNNCAVSGGECFCYGAVGYVDCVYCFICTCNNACARGYHCGCCQSSNNLLCLFHDKKLLF